MTRDGSPVEPASGAGDSEFEAHCLVSGRLVDVSVLGVAYRGKPISLAARQLVDLAGRARGVRRSRARVAGELDRLATTARPLRVVGGEIHWSVAFGHVVWLSSNSRGGWTAHTAAQTAA